MLDDTIRGIAAHSSLGASGQLLVQTITPVPLPVSGGQRPSLLTLSHFPQLWPMLWLLQLLNNVARDVFNLPLGQRSSSLVRNPFFTQSGLFLSDFYGPLKERMRL